VNFLILKLLLLLFQDLAKILHVLRKSLLKNDAKVGLKKNCYEYLCMMTLAGPLLNPMASGQCKNLYYIQGINNNIHSLFPYLEIAMPQTMF
jgi:hypothetical protein